MSLSPQNYVFVRNPGTFYFKTTEPQDWTSPQNDALWQDEEKALFDPCPPGWRMPKSGAAGTGKSPWSAFRLDNSVWNEAGKGLFFQSVVYGSSSVWYSLQGMRRPANSGAIYYAEIEGNAWAASEGYYLNLRKSRITTSDHLSSTSSYGLPVRCIRE